MYDEKPSFDNLSPNLKRRFENSTQSATYHKSLRALRALRALRGSDCSVTHAVTHGTAQTRPFTARGGRGSDPTRARPGVVGSWARVYGPGPGWDGAVPATPSPRPPVARSAGVGETGGGSSEERDSWETCGADVGRIGSTAESRIARRGSAARRGSPGQWQ
jgi:hypothetical protein